MEKIEVDNMRSMRLKYQRGEFKTDIKKMFLLVTAVLKVMDFHSLQIFNSNSDKHLSGTSWVWLFLL